MSKTAELMSQKERDYIASCFNRNLSSSKSEIDYDSILNGSKIDYDFKENKREVKVIFGKQFRKSRKYFRESESTKTSFLQKELMVVEFLETVTVLKYINLDDETRLEIENNLVLYFKRHFELLINSEKAFKFLIKSFVVFSNEKRIEICNYLFNNCNLINLNTTVILNFLDENIETMPIKRGYINKNLWICDNGFLFGMFLLLKDQSFLLKILDSFLNSEIVECKFLHKFVNLLFSFCTPIQKKQVEKKLNDHKISLIKEKIENLLSDK